MKSLSRQKFLIVGLVLSAHFRQVEIQSGRLCKTVFWQEYELALYNLETYRAYMQVDPRSAAKARAHETPETTALHNRQWYNGGMQWAAWS